MPMPLTEELHRLETETFEMEELVDTGMEMAATSSSCSCSSCSSCSTSSCCSTSTSTSSCG
ncbi:MAG TPA: thiazolylpeptide-type bacteriocin [Actinophytocola sp.]|nr:thiazolylpeptide-type bacteriocin [Actinophytocola sp.]